MQFTAQTATHQSIFVYHNQHGRYREEEKKTKQNLFVRSGKSEAELTIITEDCVRYIVLVKLTTDRHEASRGLSATAGLLVELTVVMRRTDWV